MGQVTAVKLSDFVKDLKIPVLYGEEKLEDIVIESSDVNRPGLQLAGFFDHFNFDRVQVIGKAEYAYFNSLDVDTKLKRLEKFMQYDFPAMVVTRDLEVTPEAIELAKKFDKVVLASKMSTTRFINRISNYLSEQLAPYKTIHGVLIDVYGIGILITGESGVGKSETALELIKRGHRLVADDAVEIKRVEDDLLIGQAPDLIKYLMEIRGIGILDIKSLYGVGAINSKKSIDMVVYLENWDDSKYYDRLGIDQEYTQILEVPIEKVTIPVKPGRNLAMIIEVAAKNYRQKQMGYNAAREFNERLINDLQK